MADHPGSHTLDEQQDINTGQNQEAIGSAAPAADEPLQASRLNTIAGAITTAVSVISDEQVEPPPMEQVSGPQEAVPGDVFTGIAGIATFIDSLPEAAEFAFDPNEAVRTNAGLSEAEGKIAAFGKSPEVKRAVMQPAPQEAAPPPEQGESGVDDLI